MKHIEDETPFSKEIKQSLYTSVRVSKDIIGYKKVCIKSIDHGLISTTVPHVKIAIPYDRIAYKLKYTWIDPYRGAITLIKGLVEKYADLITEKAKLVINTVDEENDTDIWVNQQRKMGDNIGVFPLFHFLRHFTRLRHTLKGVILYCFSLLCVADIG